MTGVVGPSTVPTSSSEALMQHINTTVLSQETSSISSLPQQFLTSPLRAFQHAETFAFRTIPHTLARITGIQAIAQKFWGGGGTAAAESAAATHAMDMASSEFADVATQESGYYFAEFLGAIKKLGGFFSYLTSLWSFACLVEVRVPAIGVHSCRANGPRRSF